MDQATLEGLTRTLLLLRDHVRSDVPDLVLAEALLGTRVAVVSDRQNLACQSAQDALVTAALLTARSGASLYVIIPDVPLIGSQPPLRGDRLEAALREALDDLIPGVHGAAELPPGGVDLAIVVGDTPWMGQARRVVRLQADEWSGAIVRGGGAPWVDCASPFGALAAAGLAAGEAFKIGVARLRDNALNTRVFDEMFGPTAEAVVNLAPTGVPAPTGLLGAFECVSGGAIIHSTLYALARIREVNGAPMVIEPEVGDLTNLNRYALLRRSRIGIAKAIDLSEMLTGGLRIEPVLTRYDARLRKKLGPPAPAVLVGVDDIPSRWAVQEARPQWLGVGATTHYSAMASYHVDGLGCVRCLHPRDELGAGPIPTVAFVSHWAGLWLASLFVRERLGFRPPVAHQVAYFTSLRAESRAALWTGPVAPRADCALGCGTR